MSGAGLGVGSGDVLVCKCFFVLLVQIRDVSGARVGGGSSEVLVCIGVFFVLPVELREVSGEGWWIWQVFVSVCEQSVYVCR